MEYITLKTIAVRQGELAASGDPNVVLSAVLGSCVATCLWDRTARLGGMNHILLPGRRNATEAGNKYGVYAMEALINELLTIGARKADLVAKIFGGARTFENGLRIGDANVGFVRQFLQAEKIPIVAESIGGNQARRVRFFPENGEAKQMLTVEPPHTQGNLNTAPETPAPPALTSPGSVKIELL